VPPKAQKKIFYVQLNRSHSGELTMRSTALLFTLFLSFPAITVGADYGKLIDSVDTEKATESVDTETLKNSVDGTDVDYKKAYDSVDKEKAAESVDVEKAKEALAD
jgi:hypothetical protein